MSRVIKDSYEDIQQLTVVLYKCKITISHLKKVPSSQITGGKKEQKKWVNHRLEQHIQHKLAYAQFNLVQGWPINMWMALTEILISGS